MPKPFIRTMPQRRVAEREHLIIETVLEVTLEEWLKSGDLLGERTSYAARIRKLALQRGLTDAKPSGRRPAHSSLARRYHELLNVG